MGVSATDKYCELCEKVRALPEDLKGNPHTVGYIVDRGALYGITLDPEKVAGVVEAYVAEQAALAATRVAGPRYRVNLKTGKMRRIK